MMQLCLCFEPIALSFKASNGK